MQVNPQEKIQIAYLVADTTDATLYYARAVMRDTMENTVLGTVNLTRDPANSRRFYGFIQAPSNNSPTGRYINITISLYLDAGYTNYAAAYPEVLDIYIVSQRWNAAEGGGGSGDPFYSNTLEIVREEIKKLMPVYPRLAAIQTALEAALALQPALDEAETGESSTTKTSGLSKAIKRAVRDAMSKQDPDPALAELKETLAAVHELAAGHADSNEQTREAMRSSLGKLSMAADTIVASYLYHSTKELPVVKQMHEDDEDPALGDMLAEDAGGTKKRAPSKGIVPVHVIVRNRRAMESGALKL